MRPSLFLRVVATEARVHLAYRADFWIQSVLGVAAQVALAYFVWQAMFRESGATRIGGFDLTGMAVYYLVVVLLAKLVLGPEHAGRVSQDVYEGGLNRYLVFPTSYFLFKYAQSLGALLPAVVQLALLALAAPLVLASPEGVAITPGGAAMAAVSVGAANLLYFAMSFPVQCVAFWAENVWSLAVALRLAAGLLGGLLLPLAVFPEGVRAILAWLPFRFLFDEPVRVLLGQVAFLDWLEGLGLALAWTGAVLLGGRLVWRRGVLGYGGVGI